MPLLPPNQQRVLSLLTPPIIYPVFPSRTQSIGIAVNPQRYLFCRCCNALLTRTHLLLAGNDTVPIQCQCDVRSSVHSAGCPLVGHVAYMNSSIGVRTWK